jgi:hypothetical protein
MKYLLLFLSFSGWNVSQSQESGSLLWKVSGNGLEKPSYLFGTIHIRDNRVFDLPDSVLPKIAECSAMAIEMIPDNPMEALKYVMMDSTTLEQLLGKMDYDLLMNYLDRNNLAPMKLMFARMKPLFISSMITETKISKDRAQPLDLYLLDEAKKSGKKTFGVETLKEQVSAIDAIPLKEQAKMLMESITDTAKGDSLLPRMIELYVLQDMEGVLKLMNESEMSDNIETALLTKRNIVMAERIDSAARVQNTFFAIGTAHLPGTEGVIALLRARGFSVTPVLSRRKNFAGK